MVPVLVSARGLTVREAVKETEDEIKRNIDRFDQVADALLEEIKLTHPDKVDELASFIVGCRYNQMANFLWRYVCVVGIGLRYIMRAINSMDANMCNAIQFEHH